MTGVREAFYEAFQWACLPTGLIIVFGGISPLWVAPILLGATAIQLADTTLRRRALKGEVDA